MSPNVSGLQSEAHAIVQRAAQACVAHLGDALISLVAHGSAVKGGYIAGCSDVDLILLVKPASLTAHGQLPLSLVTEIYRDLAAINPTPFRYLQVYVVGKGETSRPGFIPGAYHVVWGEADVPVASAADLQRGASEALARLDPETLVARISQRLLGKGRGSLHQELRWLCTDVWPTLYHILAVSAADPVWIWTLTKAEAIALTDSDTEVGGTIRAFYGAVQAHYAGGETIATAFAALERGVAFLRAAAVWHRRRDETPQSPA